MRANELVKPLNISNPVLRDLHSCCWNLAFVILGYSRCGYHPLDCRWTTGWSPCGSRLSRRDERSCLLVMNQTRQWTLAHFILYIDYIYIYYIYIYILMFFPAKNYIVHNLFSNIIKCSIAVPWRKSMTHFDCNFFHHADQSWCGTQAPRSDHLSYASLRKFVDTGFWSLELVASY